MLAQSPTALEILDHVQSFFYTAWGMLLATVAILSVVVGFLIPYLIGRAQEKSLKLKEDELVGRIKEATDLYEKNLKQALETVAETEKRVLNQMNERMGLLWMTQGRQAEEFAVNSPWSWHQIVVAYQSCIACALEVRPIDVGLLAQGLKRLVHALGHPGVDGSDRSIAEQISPGDHLHRMLCTGLEALDRHDVPDECADDVATLKSVVKQIQNRAPEQDAGNTT